MRMGGQRNDPAALPPGSPGTHLIGGCMANRAGLDGCGKFRSHRHSIPVASRYTECVIPAHDQQKQKR